MPSLETVKYLKSVLFKDTKSAGTYTIDLELDHVVYFIEAQFYAACSGYITATIDGMKAIQFHANMTVNNPIVFLNKFDRKITLYVSNSYSFTYYVQVRYLDLPAGYASTKKS